MRTHLSFRASRRARFVAGPLLIGLMLVLPRPSEGATRTFYMSPSGSDASVGSVVAPWRTFTASLPKLRPGDLLLVRGGTYVERFNPSGFGNPATASAPIVVKAYPGERPVIKGLFNIRGASYWTFDGINVTWDGGTSKADPLVKIMNGVGWSFRNAEVWNAHSVAGIIVGSSVSGQPSNWTISGNCVHDTVTSNAANMDHNLYIASGDFGSGLIERNILFNANNGENIKLGGSTAASRGTGRVTVRYNTMYNAAQNMVVPWTSHDNVIEWNLMGKSTGKSWYPNLRGYALTGRGNIARNNAGFAAARFLLNTDSGSTKVSYGIVDKGGNRFGIDPAFDGTSSCGGFFPRDDRFAGYGRHATTRWLVGGDWNADTTETPGGSNVGSWALRNSHTGGGSDITPFGYGSTTDTALTGDWDGDGTETVGIYRAGVWKLKNSNSPGAPDLVIAYGSSLDRPVVGDWNGDGIDTIGIVRDNILKLRNSNTPGTANYIFSFGRGGDRFVAGDWDGNGTETVGVYRSGTWFLRNYNSAGSANLAFGYGAVRDVPVVGDFNGDDVDSIGVVRGDQWLLRNNNGPGNPEISPFAFTP